MPNETIPHSQFTVKATEKLNGVQNVSMQLETRVKELEHDLEARNVCAHTILFSTTTTNTLGASASKRSLTLPFLQF